MSASSEAVPIPPDALPTCSTDGGRSAATWATAVRAVSLCSVTLRARRQEASGAAISTRGALASPTPTALTRSWVEGWEREAQRMAGEYSASIPPFHVASFDSTTWEESAGSRATTFSLPCVLPGSSMR